ncbi:hypothetical protein CEE45_01645 [Candidatus Heimdallarchaeota archaeon B3_Heim]|nr:MAG: hypothetical protein CEE45_01645 [Candidatus Heimdallarchaeota archaeon B3_Heim]
MNSTHSKRNAKILSLSSSKDMLECDHCEYVAHCDLKGPQDSVCPHSSSFDQNENHFQETDFTDRRYKEIKLIKLPSKAEEITLKMTAGEINILEYAAYQLEISLERYLEVTFRLEVERVQRKYGIKL